MGKVVREKLEEMKYWVTYAEVDNLRGGKAGEDWKDFVAKPVIKHLLVSREARAILEVFGTMGDLGINIIAVLRDLVNATGKKYKGRG